MDLGRGVAVHLADLMRVVSKHLRGKRWKLADTQYVSGFRVRRLMRDEVERFFAGINAIREERINPPTHRNNWPFIMRLAMEDVHRKHARKTMLFSVVKK